MITCYRRQFAVGQGGLHLGIITYPYEGCSYNNFVYLYDCGCAGSMKNIQENIDIIVSILEKLENLNYFYIFISHIHSDHINGIPILIDKIKNLHIAHTPVFVLPFMSDAEKLIQIGGLSFEDDDMLISFLENPHNIIPSKFDIQILYDIESFDIKENYPSYVIPETNFAGILSHNDEFQFGIRDKYSWVLLPYYYRINPSILSNIQTELANANITLNNFKEKNYLKKLQTIYKKYKCDLNLSSLCLYSGTNLPVNYSHTGWLHTGDINFSNDATFWNLTYHYDKYKDNVRVAQIPHHGSEKNSKLKYFREFHNLKTLFITTSNNTNGHGRPHVSDEYRNAEYIIFLTENNIDIWSAECTNGIIWSNFV